MSYNPSRESPVDSSLLVSWLTPELVQGPMGVSSLGGRVMGKFRDLWRSIYGRLTKLTMRVRTNETRIAELLERIDQLEKVGGLRQWEVQDWT